MSRVIVLPVCLLLAAGLLSCPGDALVYDLGSKDSVPGDSVDQSIPTSCGNKQTEGKEECDDGNKNNTDNCLNNCKFAFCGDGQVHVGVEDCDDGNKIDNDACSLTCKSNDFLANAVTVGDQRYPAVAIAPDGVIWVVWMDTSKLSPDTSGSTVRLRRFSAAGKALDATEVVVPTRTSKDQRDPDIALNTQGQGLIVWTDWSKTGGDSDSTGVRGRIVAKDGKGAGADFLINSTTKGAQSAPAVCATSAGYMVAYNDVSIGGTSHGTDIRVRRVSASGSPQGGDKQINTANQGDRMWPGIATGPNGNVLVVWQTWSSQDKDPSDIGIAGRLLSSAGATLTGEVLINSVTSGRQENPGVAAISSGYLVVWDDASGQGGDSNKRGIRLRQVSAAGAAQGQDQTANTTTSGDQQHPAVGAAGTSAMVVWEDASQATAAGQEVRGRAYSGSTAKGSDTKVNTTTKIDQVRPDVAVSASGLVVAVWESTDTILDSSGYGIRIRIMASK